MCKYTLMEVTPFICKIWKHVVINYTNNQREKQKWVTLSRKHVIDPTLNLEEILQKQPKNKKYGTHIQRTLNF